MDIYLKWVISMERNTGAFVCDVYLFDRIIRLEHRRGFNFLLIVISFNSYIDEENYEKIFNDLVLLLRTKDVISKNKKQFFILMKNTNIYYKDDVINRLNSQFQKKYPEVNPVFTLKYF